MGPKFIRDNFSDLFGASMLPVLEEVFRFELMQHPSRREMLFQKKSTQRDIWQATAMHDVALLKQVSEGQEYSFEADAQGSSKTLKPVKYGLGISISEEAAEDGKFDEIGDLVRKLAKSARESQEIQAMNIFNNGFTSETTSDGAAVFSATHNLPSGGSYSNLLSAADLSDTSLEDMLVQFETNFIGDTGIIYRLTPRNLVVHPSNKRLAMELIGSELRARTETNSTTGVTNVNNMNSLALDGLRVVSSPHLTDADAWFLTAEPEYTGLRIISRKDIETKAAGPDVGFTTDSILYKCRYREKIGVTEGYGVFGSAGVG